MSKEAKKVMVIGLDAALPQEIDRLVGEGRLPTFQRILKNGVFLKNALAPYPTITPPNWTTMLTGAWMGTHGITCFNMHKPGTPLDETYQCMDIKDCQAEYIWDAASKVGKKTILFNYPTTWGAEPKGGVRVGGIGLAINEWRLPIPTTQRGGVPSMLDSLCAQMLFSTEPYPMSTVVEIDDADGWTDVPDAADDALEADLPFSFPRALKEVTEKTTWHALITDSSGSGYDTVTVSKSKSGKDVVATLKVGEWSERIDESFETVDGKKDVAFKMKLIELSSDGEVLRLLFTPLCQLHGWAYPEDVAAELRDVPGLPIPGSIFEIYNLGWCDLETTVEMYDMQHTWYAHAVDRLLKNHEWDLFFMHAHCTDHAGHRLLTDADPVATDDPEVRKVHRDAIDRCYESLDRMVAKILENADDDTMVVLISDHGAVAKGQEIRVAQILENAGLLKRADASDEGRNPRVVMSETKAMPQRSCYIYINLKGRDPDGIVEPEDYENVRDQVIAALYDYVEPNTGKKPFSLILRKEDARILGLYGDRIGDVVYAVRGEFMGQHGCLLTTAEYGIGSLKPLFTIMGPNIKKGIALERNVWLTDLIPTICYLMGIPLPRDAEGAIIFQAMEDPNFRLVPA